MDADKIKLEPSWKAALASEFQQPHMLGLKAFLRERSEMGKAIFPKGSEIFRAFELTPLNEVKVVILGQDPYHGAGQAHGLSFSVKEGVRLPPSLKNIYKELVSDLGLAMPNTGDLTPWAKQGVLLLNSVLTVEEGAAASHRKRGWEQFTDRVIQVLSERADPIVFILWGSFAIGKLPMIRIPPHGVLQSVHPSPLSAHGGFWGSKPFSQANAMLRSWGKTEIDWRL